MPEESLPLSPELEEQKKEAEREAWLKERKRTSEFSVSEAKTNERFKVLYGKPNKPLRVGSLFSGIGAFEQALKFLGIKHETVFAGDSDKFVKQSYFANHKRNIDEEKWHDDVLSFDASEYKNKVDLLVGGPPCQSFSMIGKHGGLDDHRGNLVFEYLRIIRECRPKIFVFENVRGLLMIQDGHPWHELLSEFENLGYKIDWRCLNAKDFGIPQNRERLFVIGFRNNSIPYAWPKPWESDKIMADFLEQGVGEKYLLPSKGWSFVTRKKNIKKGFTQVSGKRALCMKSRQQTNWHGDFVEVDHDTYMDRYTLSDTVQSFVLASGSKSFDVKPETDLKTARTILSTCHKMHRAGVDNYIKRYKKNIRRLTPRECLNLMGWIDKKYRPVKFDQQVSDTQLYRQTGNSIVVWVAAQIFSTIRFDRLGLSE